MGSHRPFGDGPEPDISGDIQADLNASGDDAWQLLNAAI
jgi:hypothetical protein